MWSKIIQSWFDSIVESDASGTVRDSVSIKPEGEYNINILENFVTLIRYVGGKYEYINLIFPKYSDLERFRLVKQVRKLFKSDVKRICTDEFAICFSDFLADAEFDVRQMTVGDLKCTDTKVGERLKHMGMCLGLVYEQVGKDPNMFLKLFGIDIAHDLVSLQRKPEAQEPRSIRKPLGSVDIMDFVSEDPADKYEFGNYAGNVDFPSVDGRAIAGVLLDSDSVLSVLECGVVKNFYSNVASSSNINALLDDFLKSGASLAQADRSKRFSVCIDSDFDMSEIIRNFLNLKTEESDHPSVRLVHWLCRLAVDILLSGNFSPCVVNFGYEYRVVWQPYCINPDVKKAVLDVENEGISGLVTFRHGDKLYAPANEPRFFLSAFITFVLSTVAVRTCENSVFKNVFTFKPYCSESDKGDLDAMYRFAGAIRIFEYMTRYRLVLKADIDASFGIFYLNVFVDIDGRLVRLDERAKNKSDKLYNYAKEVGKVVKTLVCSCGLCGMMFDIDNIDSFSSISDSLSLYNISVDWGDKFNGVEIMKLPTLVIDAKQNVGKSVKIKLEDLLSFNWKISLGNEMLSEREFEKLLTRAGSLINYHGKKVYISNSLLGTFHKMKSRRLSSASSLLHAALGIKFSDCDVSIAERARDLIDKLRTVDDCSVPEAVTATLRDYQKRGYSWMYHNYRLGFGSIIADDMGLGKTLQVISLIQRLKDDGALDERKVVVVVPTGLIFNWTNELRRFAPELTCFVYHGQKRSLEAFNHDILLTSYGVVRNSISELASLKWTLAVIDEAQNIKNPKTAQTLAVNELDARVRIAMSGTPVENRLMEYWSIMNFANPGYFGNMSSFRKRYAMPIEEFADKVALNNFSTISAPFVMRRLKTDKDIIDDLPDKIEQNTFISLTPEQAALYEKTVTEGMKAVEAVRPNGDQKLIFKKGALVLQMITALKKVCNHPAHFLGSDNLDAALSGKTSMLVDLVESIVESGEKVLIFTQFTDMGEILCKMLRKKLKRKPLFLHGGLTVGKRQKMVDAFQTDARSQVFILSLRAAGVGLNLTAATHVIHFDLWWNPAVEQQATDRAYRIGQHKNVIVKRFITKDTFEEKIDAIIQSKRNLAEMTVTSGEKWIGNLSDEELHEVFDMSRSF